MAPDTGADAATADLGEMAEADGADTAARTTTTPGGRRKAQRRAATKPRLSLSGAPLLSVAGAAALIIAGVGAASLGDRGLPSAGDGYSPVTLSSEAGAELAAQPDLGRTMPVFDTSRSADRQLLREQAAAQAEQRQLALSALAEQAEERSDELALNQWVLPLAGYHLTARFGESGGMWSSTHTGLDFAAASGTTLVSVARGTVSEVGYDGAYGYKTVITLDDGTEIWYCHQSSQTVSVGDEVDPGEVIGYVGATGNVTGPHLHLEVRLGDEPSDPYAALQEHGVTP